MSCLEGTALNRPLPRSICLDDLIPDSYYTRLGEWLLWLLRDNSEPLKEIYLTTKRIAPYQHSDGSACWTKECRKRTIDQHLNPTPPPTTPNEMLALHHIAQTYVPRNLNEEHNAYYLATDKKHFGGKNEPGSKFLNPELQKIEDVLVLRMRQSGQENLHGDDRTALIARGSDPNGFMEGTRYLMVMTEGTVGIQHSKHLPVDMKAHVVRTKPGVPCSLVIDVEEQPLTDYAVLVIGRHDQTGKDFLITTFPGPVTKPTKNNDLDALEGQMVTVGEMRELLKEEFWINTKLNS